MGDTETVLKFVGLILVLYLLNVVVGGDTQSAEQSVDAITTLVTGIGSLGEDTLSAIVLIGLIGFFIYQTNS